MDKGYGGMGTDKDGQPMRLPPIDAATVLERVRTAGFLSVRQAAERMAYLQVEADTYYFLIDILRRHVDFRDGAAVDPVRRVIADLKQSLGELECRIRSLGNTKVKTDEVR
jgi:hypothetical protein